MPKIYDRNLSPYEQKIAQNKAFMIRMFINIKYKDESLVTEYLNKFQDIVNQLTAIKIILDNKLQLVLLLDSQKTLVVSLDNLYANIRNKK